MSNSTEIPLLDWDRPQVPFYLVVLILFFILNVVATTAFYIRRNHQPCKARDFSLTFVISSASLFLVGLIAGQRIFPGSYPCELNQFQGYWYGSMLGGAYSIRCWVLHFKFRLTKELSDATSHFTTSALNLLNPEAVKQKGSGGVSAWYRNHQYLISYWFLSGAWILQQIIVMIPPIVGISIGKVTSEPGAANDRCQSLGPTPQIIIYILYIAFFVFMSFKLLAVYDFFNLRNELRFMGFSGVVLLIVWIIFLPQVVDTSFPVGSLVSVLYLVAATLISVCYPVYLSVHAPPEILSGQSKDLRSFGDLLASPSGFESFKRFLEGEFSVENLMYFQAIDNYREFATLTIMHHAQDDHGDVAHHPGSVKEGWLTKKGFFNWTIQYVVLEKDKMYILKDTTTRGAEPLEVVQLAAGCSVKRYVGEAKRPHSFIVSVGKNKYIFMAKDEEHRDRWIAAFKSVVMDCKDGLPKDGPEDQSSRELVVLGSQHEEEVSVDNGDKLRSYGSFQESVEPSKLGSESAPLVGDEEVPSMYPKLSLELQPRRVPRTSPTENSSRSSVKTSGGETKTQLGIPIRAYTGVDWKLQLVVYALELYHMYIKEASFAQVNIPDSQREPITRFLHMDRSMAQPTPSIISPGSATAASVVPQRVLSSAPPQNAEMDAFTAMLVGGASLAPPKSVEAKIDPYEPVTPVSKSEKEDKKVIGKASSTSNIDRPWESAGIASVGLPFDPSITQKIAEHAVAIVEIINMEQLCVCFDASQEEVFQLMHGDSYRRYVRSSLYAELMNKMQKSVRTASAMKHAGLG